MLTYPNCVHLHPDQGMTSEDIDAVLRVAARRDEVIMFRDTGCWSRPYIALGHPTKPFHVKGKSSDWGPHAGVVPYNSEYSKAFKDVDIKKGLKLNNDAINGNYARPIPFYVSEDFINKELLVNKGSRNVPPINRITRPRDGVMYFFCTKPNDDAGLAGKNYTLLGKKALDGRYQIFTFPLDAQANERQLFLKEVAAEPLMAMTVPGADLPITGDYDLFAICPSWNNYGGADRKMDPTLDNPQQKASVDRATAKLAVPYSPATIQRAQQSLNNIQAAATPEDPDRGNITPRILSVIGALVGAMGGRFPRVHHNAESGRPFAPGAEDGFPLTVFHPRTGIGGYPFRTATITDLSDLRDYFTTLYKSGYYPPRNRSWNMQSVRNDAAVKASLSRLFASRV